MGIAENEFRFLEMAFARNILPKGGTILEVGEARSFVNFFTAMNSSIIGVTREKKDAFYEAARNYEASIKDHPRFNEFMGFFIAKQIYQILFSYTKIVSIDYSGSDNAIKVDLNQHLDIINEFDVCINCGTTEHIFNQYQAYKTIHDHTKVGGLMIHWHPTHGFNHINHGMFLIQPGLLQDMAHANNYSVKLMAMANASEIICIDSCWIDGLWLKDKLGDSDNYVLSILQKTTSDQFVAPQQYESRLTKHDLAHSWEHMHMHF
jgi:hypothetical protein